MQNSVPKAPEDLEIRNIIDKLAAFVAKNGNEFSNMTKLKQKDNPKFSFLFGGEYNDYYNYKLATEHLFLKKQQMEQNKQSTPPIQQPNQTQNWPQFNQPPPMSLETCNTQLSYLQKQIMSLQDQLQQSEKNLNAQKEVMKIKRKIQIDESIRSSNNEKLNELIKITKIDLNELNRLTNSIIEACTKEAIANGKNFVLNHNLSDKHAEAICFYLLQKVTSKDSSLEAKVHIVYLINDILHHSSKKGIDGLTKKIEAVIVPIFCFAIDKADEDKYGKLNKLLELWSKNRYFSDFSMDKMRNSSNGLQYFEDCNLRAYQDTIFMIEQEVDSKISQVEQQHLDYTNHANMQINSLQQHIQGLHQIKANFQMHYNPQSTNNNNNMYSQGSQQFNQQSSNLFNNQQGSQFNIPPPSPLMFPQSPQIHGNTQSSQQLSPSAKPVPLMSINPFCGNNSSSSPPPQPHQQNNNFPAQQIFPFNLNQPPPGFNQNQPQQHNSQLMNNMMQFMQNPPIPFPDLSKPPPGFGAAPPPPLSSLMNNLIPLMQHEVPPPIKPLMSLQEKKIPEIPYFTLPAGLMVSLIKIEDFDYRPIDPKDLKLLLPQKPSEKILKAVDAFYSTSSDRNADGWEKFGLYEFYKNKLKQRINRLKPEEALKSSKISSNNNNNNNNNSRNRKHSTSSSSRSSSRSRTRSRSRSRSRSRNKRSKRSYSRSRSRSKSPLRKRNISFQYKRSRSRSVTPPYSYAQIQAVSQKEKIDNSNKGHQLLQKMGWTGESGLGKREQGIINPIEGGEVRDRVDMYKGVGLQSDPFEQFRKNRSQTYIQRIRERDEERETSKFKK